MHNAAKLDLSWKPRRLNPVSNGTVRSLHEDTLKKRKQRVRSISPDVNAPPIDSSDEVTTAHCDVASDDSEFGENGPKEEHSCRTSRSEHSTSPKRFIASRASANGPPATAASGGSPDPVSEPQNSQKRGSDTVEDGVDEFGTMTSTQSHAKKTKRTGKIATYSRPREQGPLQNIHHSQPKAGENASKKPLARKQEKNGFQYPSGFDDKIKRAANCRSKSIDTSPQPSPRSQRASLREKKAFNVPPDSSFLNNGPKAAPRFKQFAQSAPSTYLARPTRSSAPSRHAFSSTDPNVAKLNSHLREAAHTAADKLGLTDQESPLDTSAITNSSVFSAISGAKVACDNLELDNDKLDSGRTLTESDTLPSSTVPASSLPSHSSENLTVSSGLSSPPRSPSTARCPLCNSSVDKEFFYEETGGRRLKLREQAAFCKAHNVRSANIQWRDRGYPDINWQDFDGRITGYHSVLDDILQGRRVSYYRNAFEDSMKKGMNRTLRQTLLQGQSTEALSPGYYGSKGARIMVDNIISRFANKLRRLAASDKLVASGGVSGYVQAVLVPELAVMLVMEDMGTDEDGARGILRDSTDIGNLLNEEQDEMIKDTEQERMTESMENV